MQLQLGWVHSKHMGYGRYGSYLAETLRNLGVDVIDDQEEATEPQSNVVCWVSVPTHAKGWWAGQVPTISTMWESSRLPEGFRDTLHEFDTIIVPSLHNVELFSQFHDNVKFVPLGIDPKVWHYVERPPVTNEFRFMIGGSGNRKGIDLAVKAFKRVFRDDRRGPRPTLTLKNPRGEDYYGEGIEMVSGRLSPADEVNLYERTHCYLQPSRGEGFGLQPLQAIAQGIPTILTGAHGHESFAHLGIPIDSGMSKADYFVMGDAGEWWEPDFDDLCEAMWAVYENYELYRKAARHSAGIVADEWTWDDTGLQFIEALGKDRLELPYSGTGEWYKPDARLYLVITDRDYHGEIAGRALYYEAGKRYYEVADVKRILFEGGVLDPECLTDDDPGIAPEQVERLGAYIAEKEFCPTCRQRLNSGVTKADEIYAELSGV